MNEKDIQKIYAIFFVALLVMFLPTNFTTIIKSFNNGQKRRRFSSNFNLSVLPSQQILYHAFEFKQKYMRQLIVIRMDEGLKRCSFDCGIAL